MDGVTKEVVVKLSMATMAKNKRVGGGWGVEYKLSFRVS